MFERLKRLYDGGNLSFDGLKTAVKKGLITSEQFMVISGEHYDDQDG